MANSTLQLLILTAINVAFANIENITSSDIKIIVLGIYAMFFVVYATSCVLLLSTSIFYKINPESLEYTEEDYKRGFNYKNRMIDLYLETVTTTAIFSYGLLSNNDIILFCLLIFFSFAKFISVQQHFLCIVEIREKRKYEKKSL